MRLIASALRTREVTSHQQNARMAPMINRCSKIDRFMVLDRIRSQIITGQEMAAPPVVPLADLGDGRVAVSSASFQPTARTDQKSGRDVQWAGVSQQGRANQIPIGLE